MFLLRSLSTREGVAVYLVPHGLIVVAEVDRRLLLRGAHLILQSRESGQELAVDCGGLVVSHRLRNIPLYPPVRILVNCRRYEATPLFEETWKNLNRRIECETNVCLAGEPEHSLYSAKIDPAGNLQDHGVCLSDEFSVLEYERPVRIKAHGSNLENVIRGPSLGVFVGKVPFLFKEFF